MVGNGNFLATVVVSYCSSNGLYLFEAPVGGCLYWGCLVPLDDVGTFPVVPGGFLGRALPTFRLLSVCSCSWTGAAVGAGADRWVGDCTDCPVG